MSGDELSTSMFWAGALMVFAPILFFGIVIGVWWFTKKKRVDKVDEVDRSTQ